MGAPRSSWKGFIRLSLVSIPVRSFTASVPASEIHFRQLHRACHTPIRYQKTCPVHGPVPQEEIVSGYEFQRGQFVVLEEEERKQFLKEGGKSVDIDGFLRDESVDPLYFSGKTYYLLPEGPAGQKPYALLRRGMEKKNVSAVARVVLHGREELALLRPLEKVLALSFLHYQDEVKRPEAFQEEVTDPAVGEEELRLTNTLIDATALDGLDLSRYEDSYRRRLTELIQAKVEGKEIAAPQEEEPRVIDLMEALKKSVARARSEGAPEAAAKEGPAGKGGANRPSRASQRKMAPSARHTSSRKKKLG